MLRVSADGRTATVLGYGFRQPQVGVNVRTGLVTASDQQGHYIPSTPLHIVKDRQFYGFLSDKLPREVYPAPIAEPLDVDSARGERVGDVAGVAVRRADGSARPTQLVHIGFNNPELFRVLLNNRGSRPQAAVVSITRAFEFPPLNGSVNPADGQLYLAGFQVLGWGTTSTRLAGLGRVRYTGATSTLRERGRADGQGPAPALREPARRTESHRPAQLHRHELALRPRPTVTVRRSSRLTRHPASTRWCRAAPISRRTGAACSSGCRASSP